MGSKAQKPVVFEEDLLPIKTLIDYGIDANTVKILGDAEIWNSLLIKNNKKLLAGIKGLSETKLDQICEAVDKIMASLTSEVQVFTQETLVLLEDMYNKKCNDMEPIIRTMSECVEACYSLDEMHETMSGKFGQPFKTTKNTYDYLFKGKEGSNAYKQLSLVRSAQRRAEKLAEAQSQKHHHLKVDKICEAVDKSKLEQKEQGGHQVHSSEQKEQAEQKEQPHIESVLPSLTQLIDSQKEMLDAITSQKKKLEAVMNLQTEIATKDDLESLERDLGRRLEAIGEDIVLQVVNGLQDTLTSSKANK